MSPFTCTVSVNIFPGCGTVLMVALVGQVTESSSPVEVVSTATHVLPGVSRLVPVELSLVFVPGVSSPKMTICWLTAVYWRAAVASV